MTRYTTLAEEFPARTTAEICAGFYYGMGPRELHAEARELRNAELALQWLYREEDGEIMLAPPREGIEIRRDIRKARIRLRRLRKRFVPSSGVSGAG